MNIASWQTEQARTHGAHVGLVIDGSEHTNEGLCEAARRVAAGLIELGFAPGDRVIVALPNCVELFTACSAVWMAGGVVVVLGEVPQTAVDRACAHCSPTLIVRRDLTSASSGVEWISASGHRQAGWLDLERARPLDAPLPRGVNAPAQLCYTSGTTSEPRAAVHTHGSIDAFWRMFSTRPGAAVSNPTLLLAVPPTAFAASLIGARFTGNVRYVVLSRFDAPETLAAIERYRVTELPLVPAMAQQLVACTSRKDVDLSSLSFITVSGAHVTADLIARLHGRLSYRASGDQTQAARPVDLAESVGSPTVIVAYGMTETNGCASTTRGGDGIVGTIIPGAEVRIVDPNGGPVEPGRYGEILVRTPYVASGYWNDSTETARVFHEGFVRSGDLGRFNERGELCVLGRLKDTIIQGGQNIYPEEIASVVRSCDGVDDCAVVGVADDLLGEAAVACVVRKPDASVTERAIHAHCRRHLDPRKLPSHVLFLRALPCSDVGKPRVAELRRLAEVRLSETHDHTWMERVRTADQHTRAALLESAIEDAVTEALAGAARPGESSDVLLPFGERGLDSIGAVQVARVLGARLGSRLSPALLFTYPSTRLLAQHLGGLALNAAAPGAESAGSEDTIAIVGIGCRLPGGACSPDDFWTLLTEGRDTVRRAPSFRSRDVDWQASFLDEIDGFDERFFGLAGQGAEIDPRHRMVLEVGWEALEDAGIDPGGLAGSKTGVFLGIYGERYRSPSPLGTAAGMAIARLCHFLDLRGPALSIDTTCSSSLVAVHQAVESLRRGECELALCGGVNLLAERVPAASGLAAADGRTKAFDAQADGFSQGEGCILVLLKRLDDARARADRIYAVIRGSAVNHDGRSSSLTAPNVLAQEEVLRSAMRRADVHPADVQYVETHGTGTRLGDPVEVAALSRVFSSRTHPPLRIGSVKTNIGHLEAAAGIAGLVKLALALFHRRLAPNLHFHEPSPLIPWDDIPIRVQDRFGRWPSDRGLIGGVSSFGMSGTNAHVILGESGVDKAGDSPAPDAPMPAPRLLPLSAQSATSLRSRASRFATMLETRDIDVGAADIGYTASRRRAHLEHRIALVGASCAEWARGLRTFLSSEDSVERTSSKAIRVAMVFSGQGVRSWSTTHVLMCEEPVFRETFERCTAEIERHGSWHLLEALRRTESANGSVPADIAQAATFALQVSLYELWRSWGVEPSAVVGHSLGEIAAAYASGALSLPDAARLVCARGRIMQRAMGSGKMAAARMSIASAEDFVRELGGEVEVAADNGPQSVTLTGTAAAIEHSTHLLRARGIATTILRVDCAFHSRALDPLKEDLIAELRDISAAVPRLPLISTARVSGASALDPPYWANQMRSRVEFRSAILELLDLGCSAFIEIGARPVLRSAMQDVLRASKVNALVVSAQPREAAGRRALLEALARLYRFGYPIDWSRQYPERGRVVALPVYPWEHRPHWHNSTVMPIGPLVQRRCTPDDVDARCYESLIDLADPPLAYLAGHRVLGETWFPATALLEAVREAAAHDQRSNNVRLEGVEFEHALVLTVGHPQTLRITFSGVGDLRRFEVRAIREGADSERLASGSARRDPPLVEATHIALADVQRRCSSRVDLSALRTGLEQAGFDFDDDFLGVEDVCAGQGEAIARLRPTARIAATAEQYGVHPAILDSAFRLCAAILAPSPEKGRSPRRVVLPTRLTSFGVTPNARAAWSYVRATRQDGCARFDVALCDETGCVVAQADGLYTEAAGAGSSDEQDVYAIEWRPAEPSARGRTGGVWLVLGDCGGVGTSLRAALEARSSRVRLIRAGEVGPTDLRICLRELDTGDPNTGIVFLNALDSECCNGDAIDIGAVGPLVALTKLARAMDETTWKSPPRLIIVTRGAQPADGDAPGFSQATLWGFGATLRLERPDWRIKLVDLDPRQHSDTVLCDEIWDEDAQRVALRRDERLRPIVVRHQRVSTTRPNSVLRVGTRGYEAVLTRAGSLDSIELRATERRSPGPNELEVRVHATALNFRDALLVLGRYPDENAQELLGGECAGVIARVGEGVTDYAVGDEVVSIGSGLLRSFVTLPVSQTRHKAPFLSFAQAASMSVAFATALFALEHVARVRPGERVLIHAATGGVGLAGIQHCRRVGAETLVTAGSERKRDFLRTMGIRHVFGSRDLRWVNGVMEATGGRGVDVVLNSLAGEALLRGFETLAAGGRFVELGKHDIHAGTSISLAGFRRNTTFTGASLDVLSPRALRDLWDEAWSLIDTHTLTPLPIEEFGVSDLRGAMHHLAGAKHIGKVVIMSEDTVPAADTDNRVVRADRTYLVAGGLGALGLVAAARLARCGARHLVLLARSAPGRAAAEAVAKLAREGVTVRVAALDICDRDALAKLLEDVAAKSPPLAGVVHCAGTLHDATIQNLDEEALRSVLAAKTRGTWNLHQLTRNLDFFVMFSSIAGVLGNAGQANYAAANAFLNAFAHYRRERGLPALSISWGAWRIGMAAETVRPPAARAFDAARGAEVFKSILGDRTPHVLAVKGVAPQFMDQRSAIGRPRGGQSSVEREVRRSLGDLADTQPGALATHDTLASLGIDSLATIRLRARVAERLGVTLPTADVGPDTTLAALVRSVESQLRRWGTASDRHGNTASSDASRKQEWPNGR